LLLNILICNLWLFRVIEHSKLLTRPDVFCRCPKNQKVLALRTGDARHHGKSKLRRPSYPCLPLAHKGPIVPNRQQVLSQQRRKRSFVSSAYGNSSNNNNHHLSAGAVIPSSQSCCHQMNEAFFDLGRDALVARGTVSAAVSPCRSPRKSSNSLASDFRY
jgi:hypothetical protein